ncbi:hypothetical protein GGP41_003511 [Bipolaris sorokiniana]|uniref:Uncharacterized protein n=1 Tax=Cochliobolus sativus TaxID=45130 RepID=A0A8H5ZDI2_COCSA|nr:hypothetical protein GGP41_003511 [Bipolaris sorokiniana]
MINTSISPEGESTDRQAVRIAELEDKLATYEARNYERNRKIRGCATIMLSGLSLFIFTSKALHLDVWLSMTFLIAFMIAGATLCDIMVKQGQNIPEQRSDRINACNCNQCQKSTTALRGGYQIREHDLLASGASDCFFMDPALGRQNGKWSL